MRWPAWLFAVLACFLSLAAAADATLGKNDQPIHDAARLGTAKDVERLLAATPAARDARTALGATPLHFAATNPDAGPVAVLIRAGADVNARDSEGATPLHMAAYAGKLKAAELLLQAGADPDAKTQGGRSVLSMARKMRADEVAGVISLWMLKGCKPGRPC